MPVRFFGKRFSCIDDRKWFGWRDDRLWHDEDFGGIDGSCCGLEAPGAQRADGIALRITLGRSSGLLSGHIDVAEQVPSDDKVSKSSIRRFRDWNIWIRGGMGSRWLSG